MSRVRRGAGQGNTIVHGVSFGVGVQHAVSPVTSVQLRLHSGTGVSAGWEYKQRGIKLSIAAHRALAALPPVIGGLATGSSRPGSRGTAAGDGTSPVSVNVQLQLNGDMLGRLFSRTQPVQPIPAAPLTSTDS